MMKQVTTTTTILASMIIILLIHVLVLGTTIGVVVNAQSSTFLGMKSSETRLVKPSCPLGVIGECVPWSTWYNSSVPAEEDEEIVIPCHTCVTMDITDGSSLQLTKGINVIGQLKFPSTTNTTIELPYIIVQGGLLEIQPPSDATSISPTNQYLKIIFTGPSKADEYYFEPFGVENLAKCVGGNASNKCNIGKKGITVTSGGTISIDSGISSETTKNCPTWTHVYDYGSDDENNTTASNITNTGLVLLPSDDKYFLPRPFAVKEECTDPVFDYKENFDNIFGSPGVTIITTNEQNPIDGQYLYVTNRIKSFQGVMMDLNTNCLEPNIPYLFSLKARLTSTTANTPSLCSQGLTGVNGRNHCLRLMLTKQTSTVSYPTYKTLLLHSVGSSSVPDGQWFTFEGTITFDETDLSDENIIYSSLYLMGPESGIDISLDDIKLTLPSTLSFPKTNQDVCKDLITNGHFSSEGSNTYPFYSSQVYGTHVSIEYSYGEDRTDTPTSKEDTINPYLSMKGRNQSFSSPMVQLNIGCIQHSASYQITNDIRVRSNDSNQPVTASMVLKKTLPLLEGQTIQDYHVEIIGLCEESQNSWTKCETTFTVDNNHLQYELIELFWDINDDTSSILDIDTVSMKYIGGGSTSSVIVDNANIATCWGIGSEVLLTSHTLDYNDVTVTRIQSVEALLDGKSKLTFTTPVPKVTTQMLSQNYATEIAILTRNIVMEAPTVDSSKEEDIPGILDRGGHISIIHSDDSYININGVELIGFGQASKRGKYPIGIYNSKLTSNSIISQNSIHGSYQRCIVLDGVTSDSSTIITVTDNVSYDTHGHCYMVTNDSSGITLENNIGSVTKNMPSNKLIRINTIPETDDTASTFYTTSNENNRWINNVASGSQSDGFFLSSNNNDENKNGIEEFTNNTMHSNERHGLVTYGWYSSTKVDLSGIKSYRNVEDGILMHSVGNITITNAILSDNRIGIEIEKDCENLSIANTQIIGLSDIYQSQIEETSATTRSHCPAARPLVGIQFHSSSRYLDSSYGFALDTIDFSNFNSIESGCLGSTAIDLDIENYYNNNYVNALSTLKSITYYDANDATTQDTKLNLCDAIEDVGIKNLILKDIDGSHGITPGYIVSQDVAATLPSTITCTDVSEGCYSYCTTTTECLHTLLFAFSPDTLYETFELHIITNIDDTTSTTNTYKPFILNETHPSLNANKHHYHQRRLIKAVLSGSGNYTLQFKDEVGELAWPQYVETIWLDDDTSCNNSSTKPTIHIIKPIVTSMETCNELSTNGNVENGNMNGWYYTGSSFQGKNDNDEASSFELISPGLGQSGSNAILLKNRQSIMDGIGQYLDSRCFQLGETYKVEANFGLQQKSTGNYIPCDSSLSSKDFNSTQPGISSNICPRVTLQIKNKTGTSYAYPVATAVGAQGSTKNYLYGGFKIDETMVDAESIFLVIERIHINRHLVVDDLTIVKHEDTCTSPILNGNFDTFADSRGWFYFGNGIGFEITSPGSSGSDSDYTLHTTRRDTSISSPAQDINQNCIVDGDSFTVSASIKLISSDGITPYECNPSYSWGQYQTQVCPNLIMVTQNGDGTTTSEVIASLSGTFTTGAWNQYYGNGRWKDSHINADRLFIMFSSFEPGVELYVDDIQFASKDNWNCTEAASTTGLVRNHDLQTGDARYWTGYGGALIKAEITDASTNNTSIRSYNRLDSKSGVGQMLDDGCLSTQDLYMVTANVKLYINTTQSIGCNPLSTSNIDRCPYIAIASQTYGSPIFIKPIATLWSGYGDSEDITSTSWIIEGEWNVLKGYFQLMQSELNANLKMIIVAGAPAGYDIIVDDVSFIKVSLNELGVPLVNSTTPE